MDLAVETPSPARGSSPQQRRPAPGAVRTPRKPQTRRLFTPILLGLLLAASLPGLPYYLAPATERVRHPLHAWLKPSGFIGQSAGILALAMFLFLWLYPLRKRMRWLAFGRLPAWLDVHIVVGLAVPIVGAIHASWRFSGLIGLGYLAMLIVSLSGIVGRYLYTHIPRSRDGLELDRAQVEARRHELVRSIALRLGADEGRLGAELDAVVTPRRAQGIAGTLVALVGGDVACWLAVRKLRRRWRVQRVGSGLNRRELREVGRMIRREVALTQQMALLDATRSVFRFWHVAHLPVAVTALGAVLVHVVVVVALGVTWLW